MRLARLEAGFMEALKAGLRLRFLSVFVVAASFWAQTSMRFQGIYGFVSASDLGA